MLQGCGLFAQSCTIVEALRRHQELVMLDSVSPWTKKTQTSPDSVFVNGSIGCKEDKCSLHHLHYCLLTARHGQGGT